MIGSRDWPVESERPFSDGDVTCPCGQTLHLYWNGGELDARLCDCGRYYATEHRETVLVVRRAPAEVIEARRQRATFGPA